LQAALVKQITLVITLVLAGATPFRYQLLAVDPADPASSRASVFASLVPPDVEVFVEVKSIKRLDDVVLRAQAWRLIPLSVPGADRPRPATLPLAVAAMLNVPRQETLDAIVPCRAAFASEQWGRMEDSVVLVRLDDPTVFDDWFAAAERTSVDTRDGVTRFTARGLEVARRDQIIALHHSGHGDALFAKVYSCLRGRNPASLAADEDYRALTTEVPAGLIALTVFRPSPQRSLQGPMAWFAGARTSLITLRELPGRIDIEARCLRDVPSAVPGLGAAVAQQVARLPEDTVFAWAGHVNWIEAHTLRPIGDGRQHPWVAVLDLWFEPEALQRHVLSQLAADAIVSAGSHVEAGVTMPQMAIMVRLTDPAVDVDALQTRLNAARLPPLKPDDAVTTRSEYLGIPFTELALGGGTYTSQTGTISFLANLRPALAVVDGWLVVATHPAHLRHIIDARRGLAPVIQLQPEFRRQLWRLPQSDTFAFAQPAMAAAWVAAWQQGDHRLAEFLRSAASEQPGQRRLGIAVRVRNDPGVVVIEHVYPNGPAAGVLRPGDRIVGVDGTLLSLEDTNAHLRRLLEAAGDGEGPILRIQRESGFIDVRLKPARAEPVDVAAVFRDLLQLCRQFEFAGFTTDHQEGRIATSRVSLRFREEPHRPALP